jgi:hypothetical protein
MMRDHGVSVQEGTPEHHMQSINKHHAKLYAQWHGILTLTENPDPGQSRKCRNRLLKREHVPLYPASSL